VQSKLPPVPKLTNMKESARESQLLTDKVNKRVKQLCIDKASTSLNNNEQSVVSDEINILHEIPKNNSHIDCKGVQLSKEESFMTKIYKSTSAIITSAEIYSPQEFALSECKIRSKVNHKCAYTSEGKVTLESLADAICYLNGMLKTSSFIY
jgi:hypothetical protein